MVADGSGDGYATDLVKTAPRAFFSPAAKLVSKPKVMLPDAATPTAPAGVNVVPARAGTYRSLYTSTPARGVRPSLPHVASAHAK